MRTLVLLELLFTFSLVHGGYVQHRRVVLPDGSTIIGNGTTTVDQNKQYNYFIGIPYALPPVGPLRFKDPLPLNSTYKNRIFNATQEGNICIQTDFLNSSLPVIGDEDCLVLNVYVPHLISNELLPVMVYIHGGYFQVGSSQYSLFGPDYLLNEYVIVVTLNYRLGCFGFLSSSDNAATGNYGLKDQVMALRWIQENIQSFGGDKNAITLFGQSAGSASVSYLVQSPLTNGLFNKVILQSGGTLCLWDLVRDNVKIMYRVAALLKLHLSDTYSTVAALKLVDAKRLQQAVATIQIANSVTKDYLNGLPFAPTYEPKGPNALVTQPSYELLKNHGFHKIPYMIGYTSQESTGLVEGTLANAIVRYDMIMDKLIPDSLNLKNPLVKELVSAQIQHHYKLYPPYVMSDNFYQYVSDQDFNRPITQLIKLLSNGSDVYAYNFSYVGALGTPPDRAAFGAGHGDDVRYIWRQLKNEYNDEHASEADLRTRSRLVTLWTNFARYSTPTPQKSPLLQNVLWAKNAAKDEENVSFLNIGNELKMEKSPNIINIEFWKKIFVNYAIPPLGTY